MDNMFEEQHRSFHFNVYPFPWHHVVSNHLQEYLRIRLNNNRRRFRHINSKIGSIMDRMNEVYFPSPLVTFQIYLKVT